MGFKEVADLGCDTAYALGGTDKKTRKANPTKVEGYYIGSKQVASPKSKTGYAALHVFQTPKGNVGIWGKTDLDQKMKAVKPGLLTKVEFTGMQETKNNPMYKYRVQVDSEQSIDVATADLAGEGDDDTGIDGEDAAAQDEQFEESDLDAEEAPLDEVPPTRAAPRQATAPTANAAARAQRLLGSRR